MSVGLSYSDGLGPKLSLKPGNWEDRSWAIWSGAAFTSNILASPAGWGCRFCILSWSVIAKPFRLPLSLCFFPRAVPWAVIVLHLRRE